MAGRFAPWTRSQVLAVSICLTFGAGLIGVARTSADARTDLSQQIGLVNLAVVGLVLTAAGIGSLIFIGRRAIGARRHRIFADFVGPRSVRIDVADGTLVEWQWVPGTLRAHRPSCQLVAGRTSTIVDRVAVSTHHLQRCEVCGS